MRANNSHSGVSMRLLLLNNNPAVSRLIKLSAEKAGYELDEFEDYGLVPLSTYDVILVDNELYDETALAELCENIRCDYIIYICQRGAKKPDTVNVALEKPFLPTDFLVLLDKVKNVIESHKSEDVEEDSTSLPSSPSTEMEDAFDIDQIDTLESEDDMLPINLLEENEDDFKEDEDASENLSLEDLELDDLSLEKDDASSAEEESLKSETSVEDPFSFDDSEPLEEEVGKEAGTPFEDFDFEEESHVESSAHESESEDALEESVNPSILDKDDINEVKQLLDESEDEDDEKEISELSLDALDLDKDDEAGTFFFEEDALKEEVPLEDDPLGIELDDSSDLTFEDISLEPENLEEEEAIAETPEAQEEIIDDFAEEIDEKIEEEKEQALEEEELLPKVGVSFDSSEIDDIDSLDDLNENMLKQAFGEEIVEEEISTPTVPAQKNQEIEVIRDEIESSIARSISTLAQSDILREALKGMRLNISITFDEKE